MVTRGEVGMSLDRKVRFECDNLEREEAERIVQKAGFEIIPMKYNEGLFGQYKGQKEVYQECLKELESQGIHVIYRESQAKETFK